MKILISGGGTGGHIYPGLAIAKSLEQRNDDVEIAFVGTEQGLEADIVPKEGYQLKTIQVQGLPRKVSLDLIKAAFKSLVGFFEAKLILNNFEPDIVVGTGGYVCGPIVLAAALSNIPTVIHEQNAYPGLTNRLLAKVVDKIALSNLDAKEYLKDLDKVVLTGNPIRPAILEQNRTKAFKELGLNPRQKVILVFGGSRGAKSINQAVVKLYKEIKGSNLQLLHITGKNGFEEVEAKAEELGINNMESGQIIIKPYLYNMEAALNVADLVISRAGATGLAEITACGIPAILIPYPYAAENHQEYNARSLERKNAAEVILDQELTGDKLSEVVNELIFDEQKLKKMAQASKELGQPDAAKNLVALIQDLIS
ncbi:undecaprenyldiphospho-muramoylpentapeptide beta-N-acetylglucosaminyltransferase [Natroniella sulfidigena]|uniref:undecaprenyldiphospho-muramoylpentapeptide beta-N-acetylglucosaminyltransferase n=1 Tax=Natroniella sulfidigena TaxID=723921 RepID=UPI00200B3A83|nr:undecaprenyldiphospho-muramoylpentapeptide beta-N-acetylglucosaminyltransferase [Natroniella sulfidigena]MCK8817335.1 undecaprenyldiphospho-muramoylpentapeptide beta-N-acetylglucosaminyltransferase [Natroniella sulfidigena]